MGIPGYQKITKDCSIELSNGSTAELKMGDIVTYIDTYNLPYDHKWKDYRTSWRIVVFSGRGLGLVDKDNVNFNPHYWPHT